MGLTDCDLEIGALRDPDEDPVVDLLTLTDAVCVVDCVGDRVLRTDVVTVPEEDAERDCLPEDVLVLVAETEEVLVEVWVTERDGCSDREGVVVELCREDVVLVLEALTLGVNVPVLHADLDTELVDVVVLVGPKDHVGVVVAVEDLLDVIDPVCVAEEEGDLDGFPSTVFVVVEDAVRVCVVDRVDVSVPLEVLELEGDADTDRDGNPVRVGLELTVDVRVNLAVTVELPDLVDERDGYGVRVPIGDADAVRVGLIVVVLVVLEDALREGREERDAVVVPDADFVMAEVGVALGVAEDDLDVDALDVEDRVDVVVLDTVVEDVEVLVIGALTDRRAVPVEVRDAVADRVVDILIKAERVVSAVTVAPCVATDERVPVAVRVAVRDAVAVSVGRMFS